MSLKCEKDSILRLHNIRKDYAQCSHNLSSTNDVTPNRGAIRMGLAEPINFQSRVLEPINFREIYKNCNFDTDIRTIIDTFLPTKRFRANQSKIIVTPQLNIQSLNFPPSFRSSSALKNHPKFWEDNVI